MKNENRDHYVVERLVSLISKHDTSSQFILFNRKRAKINRVCIDPHFGLEIEDFF